MNGILAGIKLTTAEYSKLRGCSERYIRSLCENERIQCETVKGSVGQGGISYLIPLASLSDKNRCLHRLQKKRKKRLLI